MRSRAVSLPRSCCFATLSAPPSSRIFARRASRSATSSRMFMGIGEMFRIRNVFSQDGWAPRWPSCTTEEEEGSMRSVDLRVRILAVIGATGLATGALAACGSDTTTTGSTLSDAGDDRADARTDLFRDAPLPDVDVQDSAGD